MINDRVPAAPRPLLETLLAPASTTASIRSSVLRMSRMLRRVPQLTAQQPEQLHRER